MNHRDYGIEKTFIRDPLLLQTHLVLASPLNLDISTLFRKEVGGNQWVNAAFNPLCPD